MRYVWLIVLIAVLISISISIAGIKKGNIETDKNVEIKVKADLGKVKFGPYLYNLSSAWGHRWNISAFYWKVTYEEVYENGKIVKKEIREKVYLSENDIANLVDEFLSSNPNYAWYRDRGASVKNFIESKGYTIESISGVSENVVEKADKWIKEGLQPYMEILNALGIDPRKGETGCAVDNHWPGRANGAVDIYSQNLNIYVNEGDYVLDVSVKYKVQAEVIRSPIVLDLDGNNKIDTFLKNHNPQNIDPRYYSKMRFVEFDINGNGLNSLVEWLGPRDGFLIAPSENTFKTGEVTGNELFGTAGGYLDGFQKLSLYDKNKDNKLTGEELNNLYIWQDLNSNGKAEKGELKKLSELGITELGLTHRNYESYYIRNGNKYKMWDFWPITVDVMKIKK